MDDNRARSLVLPRSRPLLFSQHVRPLLVTGLLLVAMAARCSVFDWRVPILNLSRLARFFAVWHLSKTQPVIACVALGARSAVVVDCFSPQAGPSPPSRQCEDVLPSWRCEDAPDLTSQGGVGNCNKRARGWIGLGSYLAYYKL